mgnify:CR=1 FL=1
MPPKMRPEKKPTAEQLAGGLQREIASKSNQFGKKRGKLIGGSDLAELLGVDVHTITIWREEGCPCLPDPRGKDKYLYDSGTVLRWKYQRDMDEVSEVFDAAKPQLDDAIEAREADRRLKVAKALREELMLANEQKLLANIEDLMVNFASAAGHVRATLMSWKSRLPGLLAHKSDDYIAKKLDVEVEDVLKSLVEAQHEYKDGD